MLTIPSRVIPACFALVGFAAAAVVGGFVGNETVTVLWRALMVMAACWLIGRLVSYVAQSAVGEHINQYKQQHPIPDDFSSADPDASSDAPDQSSDGVVSST